MTVRSRLQAVARALIATAALLLPLVLAAPAFAKYRGTDIFANIAPPPQSGPVSPHPSSYFALDTHVDAGFTNPGGYVELIPHFLASQLWDLTRFLVLTMISLFTWAFSLDLLNGNGSGGGALAAVARAIHTVYATTFGQSWLIVGILAAGLWGIWRALVQRRISEAAGQLSLSLAFVVLALFLVHSPQQTIGRVSRWTNELSLAFLGGATDANLGGGENAKQAVARRLFRSLVYEPWTVLEFGGLRHCVDAKNDPVSPFAPERRVCIDHLAAQAGRGGYAARFLRFPPGSGPRNAEYAMIRDGSIPGDEFSRLAAGAEPGQFDDYHVDEADRPAVDIQQAGGGFQRLTMAALVFAGDLGAVFLLGSLSLAVILAQVFALVFLAFAPVALVVGVFPGRGHELFRSWILRLMGALLRKAIYSLLLAVVVTVAEALLAATDSLGWLYAFGLQAALYWGIFLKRHAIAAWLAGGRIEQRRATLLPRPKSVLRNVVRAAAPLRSGPERKPFAGASDPGAHVKRKAQDRRATPPVKGRAPAGKRGSRTVDNSQSSPRKRRAPREGARPPHSAPGSEPEAPRRMPEGRRAHRPKESSPAPAPVEDAPVRGPARPDPGAHDDPRRDPDRRD